MQFSKAHICNPGSCFFATKSTQYIYIVPAATWHQKLILFVMHSPLQSLDIHFSSFCLSSHLTSTCTVCDTAASDSVSAQSRLPGITRTHDKVQYIADNSNSIAVNPTNTIILSFLFSTTHCSGSSYTCRQLFCLRPDCSGHCCVHKYAKSGQAHQPSGYCSQLLLLSSNSSWIHVLDTRGVTNTM